MTGADVLDGRRALGVAGLLRAFGDAGVLAAADVHVAQRLARLAGEDDEQVQLAAALAVRAPRLGHVLADLATIAATAVPAGEQAVEAGELPWPEPGAWAAAVAASPLVATEPAPLRLEGTRLYLDRFWCEERAIADDLAALAACEPDAVDEAALREGLARLFPEPGGERQALAAETVVRRGVTVIAGGPGTGKTTTVARALALLVEQAAALGRPAPLIALAAPTGKAATRLQEAVHEAAGDIDARPEVRERLRALDGVTLHRLLGSRPGSRRRFRHDRANRLAHDVVVVDETSMVSLELMARLLEAVRPGARLVLVGDPGQLASVEAGAVLGDVVGPASATGPLAEGVVVLDRVHRYGEAIGRVAEAVRGGHADAVIEALRDGAPAVTWHDVDAADPAGAAAIRPAVVGAGAEVVEAARRGDARAALAALGATRVLCAHRRGPYGVSAWAAAVERWLADELDDFRPGVARWYAGRPVLITENDHELRLSNGDAGVAVVTGGRLRIAFERRDGVLLVGPARLQAAESVHAMTIHKSQGSQVGTAVVVLPDPSSRILTRELLYTAVTRAQDRLVLVGPEETIRAAVQRPVARASGLRERLWDVPGARA